MNNENINRQSYINQLDKYRNIQLVKILSGIRRCGKSTLLEMYKQHLLRNGIPSSHIIHRNYSAIQYEDWTAKQMFDDIMSGMHDADTHYLLLDEVQEINGWERTVNTLLETNKTDIYITGSNSRLMSSELSTYLTGRYVQIPIYTLSFREYRDFCGANQTRNNLFQKYLR
ncbi:MAG: AAA family ATPase [Spirochaetales bacterium]|nr:AAA family ATPase [Spirochaetales bacterium]MBR6198917.1 AAA family ATPase [Spirochaetales bacterium]